MGDAQITEGATRDQTKYCILWFYVYGITQKRKEKTEMQKD